ncbi:MAG: lipoyl(octanoyl) transferase LipB [Gammaproteobacteria bacterium]
MSWRGISDYFQTWQAMRRFTEERDPTTPDIIWCLEHPPIFTLGQAGRREHVLAPGAIPVLHVDRGGQVTYHGPGQLLVYVLFDLQRQRLGVRELVSLLEQSVIDLLIAQGIGAERKPGAPGVYAGGKKVAALGLRVRRGCCYHGLAVNVDMDLEPFGRIHPCGYAGLEVTQLADFGIEWSTEESAKRLLRHFTAYLPYESVKQSLEGW